VAAPRTAPVVLRSAAMSAVPVLRAMILAAGRGERMRPLTDQTPKPLLAVHGTPLIEWHLEALARAGVREVVINTAWREEQIVAALGDGARWGLAIRYSMEGRDHGGALETAGGIAKALPLLVDHDDDAFWLVSGDIHAPAFRFDPHVAQRFQHAAAVAHLWLVPNPPFHPRGDFGLDATGHSLADPGDAASVDGASWTYANLALCRATLCAHIAPGTRVALAPLLFAGMRERRITAEVYRGAWDNLGTPAQLAALNRAAPA
jgi:N-acetyl-alpha-D-muramate 1-phosphate uridylyltransferase